MHRSNPRRVSHRAGEDVDWELRPGGMLVQKRDDGVLSSGPLIRIKVSHGNYQHEINIPAQATFGDLKKVIAQETGLEPQEQRLLFRGKEKDNHECLTLQANHCIHVDPDANASEEANGHVNATALVAEASGRTNATVWVVEEASGGAIVPLRSDSLEKTREKERATVVEALEVHGGAIGTAVTATVIYMRGQKVLSSLNVAQPSPQV